MPRAQVAADLQRHLQAASGRAVMHPAWRLPLKWAVRPLAVRAYERGESNTLIELTPSQGSPGLDVARWSMQVLDGLAFAHEAGLAHRDIQCAMVLIDDSGRARLMGLEIAPAPVGHAAHAGEPAHSVTGLQAQRRDAERDVLAFGLVLHYALTGQHALEQSDTAAAMALMPPQGREIVRLPWTTARPIPEALRVIANRATDRQQRHRYHSARTLARALEGWIRAEEAADGGPLALLIDRLRSIGALPSLPGAARRAARLALMERERTNELAEIVLQDPALCFELLRAVNTAEVRGAMIAGSGPVLTMRRAIAMVGLDGVRRAALSLRDWPGPLGSGAASREAPSPARNAPPASRSCCARPATTPRWCIWSHCCRAWAASSPAITFRKRRCRCSG
jgi:non-specific serine/threonine protein kinase